MGTPQIFFCSTKAISYYDTLWMLETGMMQRFTFGSHFLISFKVLYRFVRTHNIVLHTLVSLIYCFVLLVWWTLFHLQLPGFFSLAYAFFLFILLCFTSFWISHLFIVLNNLHLWFCSPFLVCLRMFLLNLMMVSWHPVVLNHNWCLHWDWSLFGWGWVGRWEI